MDILVNLVLALHLLALVMGMGSGMAGSSLGPMHGGATDDQKKILFAVAKGLGRTGHIGLGVLWITGIALLFLRGHDIAAMPVAFWVKIVLVVILSAAVGVSSSAARKFAAGDIAASTRMAMMGKVAALSGVAIIISAVFAFG